MGGHIQAGEAGGQLCALFVGACCPCQPRRPLLLSNAGIAGPGFLGPLPQEGGGCQGRYQGDHFPAGRLWAVTQVPVPLWPQEPKTFQEPRGSPCLNPGDWGRPQARGTGRQRVEPPCRDHKTATARHARGADSLGLTPTPQHSISVTLTLRRQSGGRSPARLTKGTGDPRVLPLLPPTQQSCRWGCPSLAPRVTPGPAAEKPGFRADVQTARECWGPPPSPWP